MMRELGREYRLPCNWILLTYLQQVQILTHVHPHPPSTVLSTQAPSVAIQNAQRTCNPESTAQFATTGCIGKDVTVLQRPPTEILLPDLSCGSETFKKNLILMDARLGVTGWDVTLWPEASRKAPMEAASPTQMVLTFGPMWRIVSNTAIPVTQCSLSYECAQLFVKRQGVRRLRKVLQANVTPPPPPPAA